MIDTLLQFGHTAAAFILIISVIVFIHEFGHYIVARACGVKIDAFSIGFGKEIAGWTDKAGTRWKVCIAPLGGYVKMYGDATEASTADAEAMDQMSDEEKRLTFHHKPVWQKALIVAAGPFFNFLTAIIIFTFLIMTNGLDTTEPVVGDVVDGTPAQEAGLQSGDRVLNIDGNAIDTFHDIPTILSTNLGEVVTMQILRDNTQRTITLTPRMEESKDAFDGKVIRPIIGIRSMKLTSENVGLFQAIGVSVQRTYGMIDMSIKFLGQVVTGDRGTEDLKGPIGIAELSGKAVQKDFYTIIWFMALISVNLGFVNILPIPPLDGGHLLFYMLEGARGRPVAEKFQEWGYRAGFVFLMSVMGFTIYNDIKQLIMS